MKINEKYKRVMKNVLILLSVMTAVFGVGMVLGNVLTVREHIATVFVFAVFVISMLTDGYVYGIVATAISVLVINFVFTNPYFAFDFTIPENVVSALVMLIISVMTSTLTTKLKRWEALKAEGEKEKMRANLLRAVSHDLRTPLTTIYASGSAILENYDTLSDDQKKLIIRGISQDSEWLARIVENLLSVTRLDGGNLKLIKTPTLLDELVDSVMQKLKKRYPEVTVTLDIPDEPLFVPMDALLIEQVLVNVLENAVQHAEGMTELSLSVKVDAGRARFEIADDGCGIDRDRLADLLAGRTFAAEGSSDKQKRNAGIGLSVCASIVKVHGGEFYAKNREGGGAVFGFSLETEE